MNEVLHSELRVVDVPCQLRFCCVTEELVQYPGLTGYQHRKVDVRMARVADAEQKGKAGKVMQGLNVRARRRSREGKEAIITKTTAYLRTGTAARARRMIDRMKRP